MIHVLGPKEPKHPDAIMTVSRSTNWSKGLSPFFLGPIECYDNLFSYNMENAWQYSKVYEDQVGVDGNPNNDYFIFRATGWNNPMAVRYPKGKGVKPSYSYWKFGDKYEKLTYVEARNRIYLPLYAKAVVNTEAYKILVDLYKQKGELWLWDFDGYDHRKIGYTYRQVFNDPNRKAGHAFVLAALLERDYGTCKYCGQLLKDHSEKACSTN